MAIRAIPKRLQIYYKHLLKSQDQPRPSVNAIDSDQHAPEFAADLRLLVMSSRASGPTCSSLN